MRKFVLLCPGQGAQSAQMFALANTHALAASFVQDRLSQCIAGSKLADVWTKPELAFENQYAQPMVVTATLANWLALRDSLPPADLVAGYSVGEIAAHAVSGSLDVHTATELAATRAALMQVCARQSHSMLAVSGISLADIRNFADRYALHVAIVTAESKAVLAGLSGHLRLAQSELALLPGRDVNLTEIPVHIASHTPLMQAASTDWSALLEAVAFRTATVPVLAGVSAETVSTPMQIRSSLLTQLTQTIQWQACMDAMAERGISFALELGPGSALASMLQARHPQIACRSVADFRSIEGVAAWVQRQLAC